jgi:hypothetical protein
MLLEVNSIMILFDVVYILDTQHKVTSICRMLHGMHGLLHTLTRCTCPVLLDEVLALS